MPEYHGHPTREPVVARPLGAVRHPMGKETCMPEFVVPETDSVHRGLSRRTVVKTAAWSVPVIAMAVAAPVAVASTAPAPCAALPVGSFTVVGGNLVSDGRVGTSPTSDGLFGTGWTPPKAPVQDPQTGLWSQTDSAVAPTPASWWSGGGDPQNSVGFLSLDDNDNRDGADQTPSVITANYAVDVKAGIAYSFTMPVYASADYLGPQYLDISVAGAGANMPGVVQGYYGNPAIAVVPNGLVGYTHFGSAQTPATTFTPSSDGTVLFTYTFTLPYVTGGSRQNADLFVTSPALSSCA